MGAKNLEFGKTTKGDGAIKEVNFQSIRGGQMILDLNQERVRWEH